MTKRMLVDATHPEETRVAVVDGNRLEDFDFERASRKQLKGNIYLAKVIRIEPSLQAAFVEYGGNRHGFLPFSEIHPDYFRIPMADRPNDVEDADDQEDLSHPHSLEQSAENVRQDEPSFEPHTHDERREDVASEALSSEAVSTEVASTALAQPLPDFSAEPVQDHGLITDFGNAAAMEPNLSAEPMPIEAVGGEMVEEQEERFRRQRRPNYKIQEVVKRRQVMLIQVVKEERGNKGAALTTFLSLAGRYCVLMPNTERGGGVSRKITSHQDRRRMKDMLDQLETPEGMAVILRTAGMEQEPPEIQRDLEYLLRLWNSIREQTLQSTAPALIYEEADLIKRSLRDLCTNEVSEILVAGTTAYQLAHDFMRAIMPDQLDKVKLYEEPTPLFFRYNVEKQSDQLYSPTVQLRSGGYIVINPTEALVSIDVNSGRATRERHIESTALKTNLEAAEEIARQLRLRDLAGLIVIDFIDMEDGRNNAAVERRMKESMKNDRARLQIGRISPFGLLELSRQRLRPSLMEINFEKCSHCAGMGLVRSVDSAALSILRTIEEEGLRQRDSEIVLHVPTKVALFILNQKRAALLEIERRYNLQVLLHSDDALVAPDYRLERLRAGGEKGGRAAVDADQLLADNEHPIMRPVETAIEENHGEADTPPRSESNENQREGSGRRRGRYGFGRNRNRDQSPRQPDERNGNIVAPETLSDDAIGNNAESNASRPLDDSQERRNGRRRGRRGGRNRQGSGENGQSYRPHTDQPRSYEPRDVQAQPAPFVPSVVPPVIPTSIHEIDTTPRDERATPPSRSSGMTIQQTPVRSDTTPTAPPPYEVVSDSTEDRNKGGWWRKLTGQ